MGRSDKRSQQQVSLLAILMPKRATAVVVELLKTAKQCSNLGVAVVVRRCCRLCGRAGTRCLLRCCRGRGRHRLKVAVEVLSVVLVVVLVVGVEREAVTSAASRGCYTSGRLALGRITMAKQV